MLFIILKQIYFLCVLRCWNITVINTSQAITSSCAFPRTVILTKSCTITSDAHLVSVLWIYGRRYLVLVCVRVVAEAARATLSPASHRPADTAPARKYFCTKFVCVESLFVPRSSLTLFITSSTSIPYVFCFLFRLNYQCNDWEIYFFVT